MTGELGTERADQRRPIHDAASREPKSLAFMSPAAFAPMNGLPGLAALARDEHFRLLWCNGLYAKLCGRKSKDMLDTKMTDFMPVALAKEREDAMRPSLTDNRMITYYQFWHGSRWYTRVWPLDPNAFGKHGVFVIHQSIAQDESVHHDTSNATHVLTTGQLDELEILSPRELEVCYYIAKGLTSAEIASHLFRSARTIEQHTNQIYKKLGISSRAQLAKIAVERGIVAFTPQEWQRIVHSRAVYGA